MIRRAIVAGQFYPASKAALADEVAGYLAKAGDQAKSPTILAMAPHAGYVYSGAVAGIALGRANLARRMLLLGPNHTGLGKSLAVWASGVWHLPGGEVPVDEALAQAVIGAEPRLAADTAAHLSEHSLEVLLPFLMAKAPGLSMVPVCVAESNLATLLSVGENLGKALSARDEPVSIVVSTDMSHYVSLERAEQLDSLALERILALDPEGLYAVVKSRGISMCGVYPMALGLAAAKAMGARTAELAAYATSGDVTGDYGRVVGYAGVLVQ